MDENKRTEGNLAEEFRQLGKNLSDVLRTAWDSPERKRVQEEIASELVAMGNRLREEGERFAQSPTGQQLKTDVEGVASRVRSGEMETAVRTEIASALRMANRELEKARAHFSDEGPGEKGPEKGEQPVPDTDVEREEVHPDDVDSSPDQTGEEYGRQEIHPDDVESTPDRRDRL